MPTEVVVFLPIGKQGGEDTAFCGSQGPVVKKPLLPERFGLPAHHPCGRDCYPIDSASLIWCESSDLLKAALSKHLAAARNMVMPLKALPLGAVSVLFEDRSRDPKVGICIKLAQDKLNIIHIEGNISIEIPQNLIVQVLDSFIAGVESLHFGCKAAVSPLRHLDQFDPRILYKVAAYDFCSPVCRSVVHDHPFRR